MLDLFAPCQAYKPQSNEENVPHLLLKTCFNFWTNLTLVRFISFMLKETILTLLTTCIKDVATKSKFPDAPPNKHKAWTLL